MNISINRNSGRRTLIALPVDSIERKEGEVNVIGVDIIEVVMYSIQACHYEAVVCVSEAVHFAIHQADDVG